MHEVAAQGANIVEVDVRTTADGELVLMHDSTLARTTDQEALFPDRGDVSRLTLDELKTLTLEDPSAQWADDPDALPERCRVPTLGDMLDAARDVAMVMLDVKDADATTLADLLTAHDAVDTAYVFDANTDFLDEVQRQVPGVVTMARAEDADSGRALIADRAPYLVRADTGYLAALAADARDAGVKPFVNIFGQVDFSIIGGELTGDATLLDTAQTELASIIDDGAAIVQTNRAPVVREMIDR